jgi:translocation and assembly module TamB
VDNANGVLVFDRNRIVIREMQAQSGGGDITLRGFVGFGGKEMAYRLQAQAKNVRVRYPEGVSTTFDANLSFTGTLEKSLLSGTATVVRSGFNAKTDFGGVFASTVKPVEGGLSTISFLQGLQYDITVVTAPDFQLLTSYAKNVQTDARLHLRGTAAKPSVLGRIVVSEGEVDFFGGRYTVTRGEVNFYNPSAIEPVLDADLETKVRAVTVNIKLSGTPSRMRISYRSDPPLSSTEIISLLTVGRSPEAIQNTALPSSVSESGAAGGGGALLGQVLSTSVSGALQKFFGVSRVKIDPRAIGVDGTPQAQLTVEQQISRDVTLTYSTSLQNSQQQIVRVEWNVSKQFSAVAVRDQFGLFGIDFYYKRRVK